MNTARAADRRIDRFFAEYGYLFLASLLGTAVVLHLQPSNLAVGIAAALHATWIITACILFSACKQRAGRTEEQAARKRKWALTALAFSLFLALFTPVALMPDAFFTRWLATDHMPVPMRKWEALRFLLLSAVLIPVFLKPRRLQWFWGIAFVAAAATCFSIFLHETGMQPLYNDDHPSFLLRLHVFGKVFPRQTYYNPFWNGGQAVPYVAASGVSSFGVLFWPLWRWFPITLFYTPAIGLLMAVVIPLLVVIAVRLCNGSWSAAFLGGILATAFSRDYFLWLLHFGTIGASASLPFLVIIFALLYRILHERLYHPVWLGFALAVTVFIYAAWPPAVLMAIPLLLGFLVSWRSWTWRRIGLLALSGTGAVLLCLPAIAAILGHTTPSAFVQSEVGAFTFNAFLLAGWEKVGAHIRSGNPLILFFGLAGWWLLPERRLRIYTGVVIMGLLLISAWGSEVYRDLALARAALPLFLIGIIPAARLIAPLFEEGSVRWAPLRAVITALLVASVYNSILVYRNVTHARYRTMPEFIPQFAEWIREQTPENGRILFAGYTVHGYGGGHVAYLPVMTGREMMACDYYHFSPQLVEYNYPPRAHRKKDKNVHAFFDMYNVAHVVTFHRPWFRFFRRNTDRYTQSEVFGDDGRKKVAYSVNQPLSLFLRGSGAVEADINILRIRVDDPEAFAVLKYNWADGLRASSPAEIEPFRAADDIRLIGLHPNGATNITIRYRGKTWRKLLQSLLSNQQNEA